MLNRLEVGPKKRVYFILIIPGWLHHTSPHQEVDKYTALDIDWYSS